MNLSRLIQTLTKKNIQVFNLTFDYGEIRLYWEVKNKGKYFITRNVDELVSLIEGEGVVELKDEDLI